jgi:hypothetical protein
LSKRLLLARSPARYISNTNYQKGLTSNSVS